MEYTILHLDPIEKDSISKGDFYKTVSQKGEKVSLSLNQIGFMVFLTWNAGIVRANHYHERKLEYIYITRGHLEVYLREGGNSEVEIKTEILRGGDLIIIQPGLAHAFLAKEPSEAIEFSPQSWREVQDDVVKDRVI